MGRLDDEHVSRRHLRLVSSPTALSVVDLGSRHGTTVNGTTLAGRVSLRPGDVIRLGRSEILVLHAPRCRTDAGRPRARRLRRRSPHDRPDRRADRSRLCRLGPNAGPDLGLALTNRLVGIDHRPGHDPFGSFTELPSRTPAWMWSLARVASLAAFVATIVALFVRPAGGLFVLFGVVVPMLPVVFLVAPGFWRNVCPLAASNQLPRRLGFSRSASPPTLFYRRGYVIAMTLFFGIAGSRLAGLDRNGVAAGIVLALAGGAAFAGGVVVPGQERLVQQHLPVVPAAAGLRPDTVHHRPQPPVPLVRGLCQELLRLPARPRLSG